MLTFKSYLTEVVVPEKAMQDKISKAFAQLNDKLIKSDQEWAKNKIEGLQAHMKDWSEKNPKIQFSGWGEEKAKYFGGKSMMNLLDGRGLQGGLDNMLKNTMALIAKRDAQIITALVKKGITEVPDFELTHVSDGFEGSFKVDKHHVSIRTIVAGGYNIQRMHMRTLVKVS